MVKPALIGWRGKQIGEDWQNLGRVLVYPITNIQIQAAFVIRGRYVNSGVASQVRFLRGLSFSKKLLLSELLVGKQFSHEIISGKKFECTNFFFCGLTFIVGGLTFFIVT